MSAPWLAVIGIGEDGVAGLAPAAAALVTTAGLVLGGARHLALAAPLIRGERQSWPSPMTDALPGLLARRGRPTCVLASGDPNWFGVGRLLAAHIDPTEMAVWPAPSAFSLACARLGWSLQDVTALSFCGRPLDAVIPRLQPGRRLLCLSADQGTPAALAKLLDAHGFGPSAVTVLEALGGPQERWRTVSAAGFDLTGIAPLNLVAVALAAAPGRRGLSLAGGLDDALFEHDGQLTKREVRAVTLSSLAPNAGELLWDIGCGSGAIAIEWLLRHPAMAAIAVEAQAERAARAARNALALGAGRLTVVAGPAPQALEGLPAPDAVFIGGGLTATGLVEAAWAGLKPGGRLVANSVTLEGDAVLAAQLARLGGDLTRIGVARLDRIGGLHGFRPAMTVTQWRVAKP